LLSNRPDLLVNHATAYGALIEEQASLKFAGWRRTAIRQGIVLIALGVACISAEVAVMLWAVSTSLTPAAGVTLIVTPILPLLIAGWFNRSEAGIESPAISQVLQAQIRADWSVLQDPGA
jgi:Kef-type K+ transport system membrane component KefB